MSDQEERPSFEGRTSEERLVNNSGLKLKNKGPSKPSRQSAKAALDNRVDEIQEEHQNAIQQAINLGSEFKSLMKDKTLTENMGPMQKSLRQEVLTKWQNYILEQNNPPDDDLETPEGMGSLSGILILFSSLLQLKDRVNDSEYRVTVLEKENKSLKDQINKLNSSSGDPGGS